MKRCTVCRQFLASDKFYKNRSRKDGLTYLCKECMKSAVHNSYRKNAEKRTEQKREYVKNNYEKHLVRSTLASMRWGANNRDKVNASQKVRRYIKSGKIKKRNICEFCFSSPTHCHHEDYNKPVDIIEMCQSCHERLHRVYNNFESIFDYHKKHNQKLVQKTKITTVL